MENINQENEKNPLKKWVIILGALCVVLLFTTLYFGFFAKPVFNSEYTQVTHEKENLQAELDALLAEHDQIKRLYDMLNKTNQLNFTKRRPSLEQLTAYIDNPSYECRYVRAKDKYGDYGIIGFYILN